MANLSRTFIKGRMNKSVDERLVPDGEYIDALNVRLGSTEDSEIGVVENSKGNTKLTSLVNVVKSSAPGAFPELVNADTTCIGAYADSANETIYWFVHAENVTGPSNGILDLIISYNTSTEVIIYHVVSSEKTNGASTSTLNFNTKYLITSVNRVGDLLFFTDNYNPPRFININRDYGLPDATTYEDPAILEEQLLVIKKPPLNAPTVNLLNQSNNSENFLDERFICFGYRYRYADGDYSATSPFSAPAFGVEPFRWGVEDFLNDGMTNQFNVAEIQYNTGGQLVIGIDILFKDAADGVIKVIEKINKSEKNLTNNSDETYLFDKSKIYTILPSSEILRLYDNVPKLAKAQTLIGNRLIYGNYKEGYDLVDSDSQPVNFNYTTEVVSSDIQATSVSGTFSDSSYNISSAGATTVADSIINFDLSSTNLPNPQQKFLAGARFDFTFSFKHAKFYPHSPSPLPSMNEVSDRFEVTFSYSLDKDYSSASDIISDPVFENAIGTLTTIQTVADACDGQTLTDLFNCATKLSLTSTTNTLTRNLATINSSSQNQPIKITSTAGSDTLSLKLTAMKYQHDSSHFVYEMYSCDSATCVFIEANGGKSLHSNRDYSVGMIYMDDYGRQTTVLTGQENTVHVPFSSSVSSNKIKVTIPSSQNPPSWATHYKFALKANADTYETIYSNIYFTEGNFGYILLEGENAAKVQEGDLYFLKADSSGPILNGAEVMILEKKAQEKDFLSGSGNVEPAGVYAKVHLNNIDLTDNSSGRISNRGEGQKNSRDSKGALARVSIRENSDFTGSAISIAAGDRITIFIRVMRNPSPGCSRKSFDFDRTFVAPRDYATIYDWFYGENIDDIIRNDGTKSGTFTVKMSGTGNDAFNTTRIGPSQILFSFNTSNNTATNFQCRTFENCGNNTVVAKLRIDVLKVSDLVVFETKPVETNPDIFYEGDETFTITSGVHDNLTPTLSFFNCFAFGNGVESYKIKDSVVGATFGLGNRVSSVSSQDYEEMHRSSDVTYSGIFNDESNVNKLNEFNLGLSNFKALEQSYGVISLLDTRETDLFVLQEDKISYVLAGKNLLSDAAAGSAITSVPEVLGTQIARTEDYGNSFNPESYVRWGADKFFTDSKRGAVIQLSGQGRNEQLSVISEFGMRSWFRNLFIEGLHTQKLGAFDPYMNEYVLASNNIEIPFDVEASGCGRNFQNIKVNAAFTTRTLFVDFDEQLGLSTIFWAFPATLAAGTSVTITMTSGSDSLVTTLNSSSGSAGTFTFTKNDPTTKRVKVVIQYQAGDPITFTNFVVGCLEGDSITVRTIVLTDNVEANETITTQYDYSPSGTIFRFQRVSNLVTFSSGVNPFASRYSSSVGFQGQTNIPTDSSNVKMYINKLSGNTFDVDTTLNKFRYLITTTNYGNNRTDLQSLIDASTELSVTGSAPEYSANFNMPSSVASGSILYLVWDLRKPTAVNLCFDDTSHDNACCNCRCDDDECSRYTISVDTPPLLVRYTDCTLGTIVQSFETEGTLCSATESDPPEIISGTGAVTFDPTGCDCGSDVTNTVGSKTALFMDGNDFSRATVLSTNINLKVDPTDGYYSDESVARKSASGDLEPSVVCTSCT